MNISCGVDIVEISRVEKSINNTNKRFISEIYTEKEIEYCESKGKAKFQHYAARFAAKEAVFKAISNFLKDKYEITWKNIQILNDKNGRPYVEFIGIKFKQIESMDISISHSQENAVAQVVILYSNQGE